jgi:hypothetical protein
MQVNVGPIEIDAGCQLTMTLLRLSVIAAIFQPSSVFT